MSLCTQLSCLSIFHSWVNFSFKPVFSFGFGWCRTFFPSSCHWTTEGKVNEFISVFPSTFIHGHVHSPMMTNVIAQQLSQCMNHKRTIRSVAVEGALILLHTFSPYMFEASRAFSWFSFYELAGSVYDSPLPIILPMVRKIAVCLTVNSTWGLWYWN